MNNETIIAFDITEIQSYGLSVWLLSVYLPNRVEVRQFHSKQGATSCWLKLLNNQSKAA